MYTIQNNFMCLYSFPIQTTLADISMKYLITHIFTILNLLRKHFFLKKEPFCTIKRQIC